MDKRHLRRQKIVQQLYASTFDGVGNETEITERAEKVLKHTKDFDSRIQEYAQKYSIDKIARVDLAILRLALYELVIEKKVPPKVVINEAVELAKEMGGEKAPGFINAVLGKIYEGEQLQKENNE